ncbi:very short patch repair endonuclease [Megasphaera stantonii]|uniref:very short patch repair endonuclease n=1 Tax=Megasphaera stantonii TaxID=2144175 RepID=UPI00195CA448|nr:very short patch repair endonuclease [Megasphaera stantonii]MBM6731416.1 very short patch repair endonuclease [Megasphaera stantonii]
MDRLTPEQRHKNMSRIRSKNTKAELLLRKALWKKGIRYRKNVANLTGKPDIVITRCKIAVFVDGDFWHGNPKEKLQQRLGTNRNYWIEKIEKNKARDKAVTEELTENGWLVLRFWESDVKKDLNACVDKILSYIPYI